MKQSWVALGIFLAVGLSGGLASAAENDLYYAAEKPFLSNAKFEMRLGAGYDFSNPYINVYSGSLGLFYLIDRSLAPGIEVNGYTSGQRGSAQQLETELAPYNYKIKALAPQYSLVGVFRVTPISGVVNLLSTTTMMADVHLLGRAGVIQYDTVNLGPTFGLGVEFQMELNARFGFAAAVLWDIEKPGGQAWITRTGFRVGPSLRF